MDDGVYTGFWRSFALNERGAAGSAAEMKIPASIRHWWEDLKRGEPGHRFQDRYVRARRQHDRQHFVVRILKIVAAIVVILIGIVEIVFPGPAFVFLIVGGGLLATEARPVARFMDASEVRLRRLWRWAVKVWRRARPGLRHTMLAAFMCMAAGGAFVAWRVVFR